MTSTQARQLVGAALEASFDIALALRLTGGGGGLTVWPALEWWARDGLWAHIGIRANFGLEAEETSTVDGNPEDGEVEESLCGVL